MQEIQKVGLTSPARLLLISFLGLIMLGTVLLKLPASTHEGISFVDALFTSTSAVCVTGIIVKDTPVDFTVFGQAVILVLIQAGGLGYMTLASILALAFGRRIGFSERLMMREAMNVSSLSGIVSFLKRVVGFIVAAEALGALVLAARFSLDMEPGKALLNGLFHSVSAFNNAGFSLFSDNLMRYRGDMVVNLTIMTLIVVGGLGFFVVVEIYRGWQSGDRRYSVHTKIVLSTTSVLIVGGALLFYMAERHHILNNSALGTAETVLISTFASITPRTAGFNTLDYSVLQPVTLFLSIVLMMIGASPGGTGGGIKTSTTAVILLHIWSTVRGRRDTVAFERRIGDEIVSKSLVIMALAILYVNLATFLIIEIENTGFEHTLFEVVSAFGTVGLSVGDGGARSLSAKFSDLSKLLISFTMLMGRVGPLTLFTALLQYKDQRFRYPEERILIG